MADWELYHQGETGRFDNGMPVKSIQGHGPMLETGDIVPRGRGETHTVVCPNIACGWTGYYTAIGPVTAFERMVGLQSRNVALRATINNQLAKNPEAGLMDRRLAQLTYVDRMEFDQNAKEIERLRGLARDAHVGWKFVGTYAGGLRIVPTAAAVDAINPAPTQAQAAPAPAPAPVEEKPTIPQPQPRGRSNRTNRKQPTAKQLAAYQRQRDAYAAKKAAQQAQEAAA